MTLPSLAMHSLAMPSLETLLLAGRAVFLVFSFIMAAVTFTAWRRSAHAQTQQVIEHANLVLQRLAHLEARVDATKLSVSELGERVERPQQLPTVTPGASAGYQLAIRLAKTGATREELVSGCGLSVSEAELVRRLHAPAPASAGHVTNS